MSNEQAFGGKGLYHFWSSSNSAIHSNFQVQVSQSWSLPELSLFCFHVHLGYHGMLANLILVLEILLARYQVPSRSYDYQYTPSRNNSSHANGLDSD